MKVDPNILLSLQSLARQQQGVLTTSDLTVIFMTTNRQLLKKRVQPYLESELLIHFCRGFYITPETNLEALSQRITPRSIISLGTVLSKERLVGTIPRNCVYAIKLGKTRKYENDKVGKIIQFGFGGRKESAVFDFGYRYENGICYAEPERALLDTLYFYQRGNKFFFNIYSDVERKRINREKFIEYIEKYSNSRFRAFARSYIDE